MDGSFIVKRVLGKGAYELVDYDGIPLSQPRNGCTSNVTIIKCIKTHCIYALITCVCVFLLEFLFG